MLFNSNIADKIPALIIRARENYDLIDFQYFDLLYKLKYSRISQNDFYKGIGSLSANNYSPTKIFYLKTLFYPDISGIFKEYASIKDQIEPVFKKKILFNMLDKAQNLSRNEIIALISDWVLINGQNDALTDTLLKKKHISVLISADKNLNQTFLKFTGVRLKDRDEDGFYEEYFEYRNGILLTKIIDSNQDGVPEFEAEYFSDGKIKEFVKYRDNNNYEKYTFNNKDSSLISEVFFENKMDSRVYTFLKSAYFPKEEDLKTLDLNSILKYADKAEIFDNGHELIKYSGGKVKFEYIDEKNNGFYGYKKIYKNGIIIEALKDVNENGIYEIREIYSKGKLNEIWCKTDEMSRNYDFIEKITDSGIEKYWDENNDGIFEVSFIEKNDGTVYKLFDIDFDGKYDYGYEYKNSVPVKLYKIVNEKWNVLENFTLNQDLRYNGWTIITEKTIDKIAVPEKIELKNNNNLSGLFSYNGKRQFFEKGIIKIDDLDYKLFLVNNEIYLLDLSRF
jgi:hypothetical protein